MTSQGKKVEDCPIKQEVCYPSCFYWGWDGEKWCHYAQIEQVPKEKKKDDKSPIG